MDDDRGQRLKRISQATGVSRPRILEMLFDAYADTVEVRIGGKPLNEVQPEAATA
jgi:hypothetical protein